MTIPSLIAGLAARGIELHLQGDGLGYRGPAGALTDDDKTALRARKPELIAYLRARAAVTPPVVCPSTDGLLVASLTQQVWWRLVRPSPIQLRMEKLLLALPFAAPAERAAEALKGLVARHDCLRSRLTDTGDGPPSVSLNRAEDFDVEVGQAEDEAGARALAAEFVAPRLPVDGDWLCRGAVYGYGDMSLVVLVCHHIVFDGSSMALAAGELNDRIFGFEPEGEAVQFTDYARWEKDWFASGSGETLAAYWRDWLAAIPPLRSPSGADLRWKPGARVDHPFDLPADLSQRLDAAATRLKTTPFVVILAAYATALSRWSGQACFPLRSVGDLRASQALSGTVGLMLCADALEIDTAVGPEELVRAIAAEYRSATALRLPSHPAGTGAGYEEFHERIGATINYIPAGAARIDTRGPPILMPTPPNKPQTLPWPVPLPSIFLRLWDVGAELAGRLEFNEAVLSTEEQLRLVKEFQAALAEFTS
jgi:hypothetical protein